ncbi:MAG TPA: HlyD family efflux transporter periplasmic adaptor subunit [Pseudonocardiaceae bacterium]|nr:HlyD family efflux transporter periplasmic adaptor subunit [Pseudonocardiaceae bacterium]
MADLRLPKFQLSRRVIVITIVVVVAGAGAGVAWTAMRPAGAVYRTATAGPASVTDTLAGTGTIQPVTQATVSFPMSGQVASVAAELGQQVAVGQTLAQLNTTSLNSTVSSDESAVASAQAKLASDQTSETSVSDTADESTSPSSAGSGHSGSGQLSGLEHSLSGDQNAVRKARQKVDSDLTLVAAADHKVNADGAACQDLLADLAAAGTSQPPTSTTPPTTSSTPDDSTAVSDCETLINEALAAESTTGADEHTLSSSVAALSSALNKVVAAVQAEEAASASGPSRSAGASGGSSSTHGTGGSGSAAGGSGGGRGGGSSLPASADQIAADQAAVDAANAQLAAARQNLSAATLVSPITGTVADVTITAGQSASANSTSAQVVIIGPGQDEVLTAVTDSQVGQVKPGENATVTPDGATKPISGTVTQIGALGTTTTGGSASYPVTISLDNTAQQMFDGATASVGITLGTADAAVTVPTSAIHTVGAFTVVTKMVDGKPTVTRVTVGVRGPVVTQVTSGLKAGDEVALANINEPMPTAGNTTGAGRFGGGLGGGGARAAFGGGGGFGGGRAAGGDGAGGGAGGGGRAAGGGG